MQCMSLGSVTFSARRESDKALLETSSTEHTCETVVVVVTLVLNVVGNVRSKR